MYFWMVALFPFEFAYNSCKWTNAIALSHLSAKIVSAMVAVHVTEI